MKKTTTRIGSFLLMLVMLAGLLPVIAAPASAYTLQEKRQAVIQTAWAYYDKGRALQYDSIDLSIVPKTDFGPLRVTYEVTPEYATPDETMFSVCSDYCYQIYYNAFGYRLRPHPIYFYTGGIAKMEPSTDPICVYRYDSHTAETENKTPEVRAAAIDKYIKQLQPGDIINAVSEVGGGGHAMLYIGDVLGDGKNYILHCEGNKYNTETGEDRPECNPGAIAEIPGQITPSAREVRNDGGICLEPVDEYLHGQYNYPTLKELILSVIRPLDVIKDDANPLTPSAQARLQFPRLVINRTASGMRFRDVEAGGNVTLKVELTNKSDKAYTVPVREVLPDNVSFVKASDGANASGNEITWEVALNAGETKVVSYDCTVNAKRGERIVFTGGSVSTIPSNTISIPVGGKHLTAEEEALLADVAAGKYKEVYKGVDKDVFPSIVWQKILKLNVALPTLKQVISELNEPTTVANQTVYALRSNLTGELADMRNMVVPEFYGGFVQAEMDSLKRVLDLRCDYLRPGDVVFEFSDLNKPTSGQTLVYLGNEKFLRQVRTTGGASVATFFELQKAHTFQLFYVLRPTLAYDDVHNLPKLANPVDNKIFKFTDVQPSDWFYNNVRELASDGIIKGMTETTFAPNGTLTYGQALKLIGMAVGQKEPAKSGAHWASGWLTLAKSKGWLAGDVNLDSNIT
ncbi:MAG: S-layer homology domain-containing protein, partial [Oscillospiraceae bacterium]|nr:S-layer homology domain-containing protein [Oscillospiraceae bacterium]